MSEANMSMTEEKNETSEVKKSYHFDLLALVLWIVIMWGFLGLMTITDNPPNVPGIHILLMLGYFLGFTFVYAAFYIIALRKGV